MEKEFLLKIQKNLQKVIEQINVESFHNWVSVKKNLIDILMDIKTVTTEKKSESWFEPGKTIKIIESKKQCPCFHCQRMFTNNITIRDIHHGQWLFDMQNTEDGYRYAEVKVTGED